MGLVASVLWIVVGVIYTIYKYFQENQVGVRDLFAAIKGTLPVMIPLFVGVLLVNIVEGSTSVIIICIGGTLIAALGIGFLAFVIWAEWGNRQDTKKQCGTFDDCEQCTSPTSEDDNA